MRWSRTIGSVGALLAAWAGLAAWQYDEYGHECDMAKEGLARQADSVMNALVGGIRSHRRMGRFFPSQLQGVLEELTDSKDILAAALVSEKGDLVLTAGQSGLLDASPPIAIGRSWDQRGLRYAVNFHLAPEPDGGPPGPGAGRGGGPGGGGWGWGRGPRGPDPDQASPLAVGGRFTAVLLLDRGPTDAFCRRAWWVRFWLVAAGGVVLIAAAVAWHATVRWTAARARSRLLEAEARHLRDLSHAAAGLAHETRNPLGLIRGWTQRLADSKVLPSEHEQQARAILEECDRVTSRVNQFLAFAKPRDPSCAPLDTGSLIDELAMLLEPDLEAKQLTLERFGVPSPTLRADREMLRQALFNLVRNAILFSPPQAAVEIGVVPGENGHCRIEVADRGPGVPPEQVDLLFTPYFTTRTDGTGLGLAIVRRIAAGHGWEAGYRPRPGGGSVFWLDGIHG
jgi:signal transduction histidine kinase